MLEWLLPVGFLLLFVGIFVCFLAEGVTSAWRWRTVGRAAYQKECFIQSMKLVLRELGSEFRVERKRLKKALEEQLDDASPE